MLTCLSCGQDFPRQRMGRPPQRCVVCRDERRKAKGRERVLRWAAKQAAAAHGMDSMIGSRNE